MHSKWFFSLLVLILPGTAAAQELPVAGPLSQGLGGQQPFQMQAWLGPSTTQGVVVLHVQVKLQPGWWIYSVTQPKGGPIRTSFRLQPPQGVELAGKFRPDKPPKVEADPNFGGLKVEKHLKEVTWRAPLRLAAGIDPRKLEVPGSMRAMVCNKQTCLPPKRYRFTARWRDGPPVKVELASQGDQSSSSDSDQGEHEVLSLLKHLRPYTPETLAKLTGADLNQLQPVRQNPTSGGLLLYLALAFLGGLVLNVMPCVLPVLGLKVMSFIQQSGESRARAFLLNVYYSLGLLSVFWALALAAVVMGLQWGQQFASVGFTAAVTAVVFVFALALLGVWEIPIPGFVGSGKAGELAQREGPAGAFLKGVLTTVLATPCTGPFMGTALMWAVKQNPGVVFATFTALGLGMATPYLVVGLFPRLVAWLPKPGPWMETFKHLMGFVLLGTVVWLLTTLPPESVVPTVALLFGLWLAFWWVGQVNPVASAREKLRAWLVAGAITVAAAWVSFGYLSEVMRYRVRWREAMTVADVMQRLARSSPQGTLAWNTEPARGRYTVLVDFTADW